MDLVETEEGPKVVINANSYFYFQTIVYLLDARTGSLESEYLHIGHMLDMILQDITGDGVDEVMLSGINNAYWMASLAVLDVENLHGYSPLTRDYRPTGMQQAEELHYLLFPKTLVGSYTNPVMKYNEGHRLNYDLIHETIRIQLEEGRVVFREEEGEANLLVTMDKHLKPIGVGTSDVYDIVARQLYEEGQIPEIPDFDYFQAYKDSILYWTGEEFLVAEEYFKEN
ncbi:MAG: hypothetical protein GVY07_01625 [Bacteroidetes bacterium]|nr:hypothetical protein [Bacteroidota bacterium]